MKFPVVAELESRDGTTDRDERLVNAYIEVDIETSKTMACKRPGIELGEAVITGPDAYIGQGMFNYDGYWFWMSGDILGWVWVYGTQYFGSGGAISISQTIPIWDVDVTYDLADQVFKDGQVYTSYSPNNLGEDPSTSPLWGEEDIGEHTYQGTISGWGSGEICSTIDAAGYSAYMTYPYKSCATREMTANTWKTYAGVVGTSIKWGQYSTYGPNWCVDIISYGVSTAGSITQIS